MRPSGRAVALSAALVQSVAPVPPDGALPTGTRIQFSTGAHQDVKEPFDEVVRRLS